MILKQFLYLLTATALLAPVVMAQTAAQIIHGAAQALGGEGPLLAVKTLIIEGEGEQSNLGQNVTPDGEQPVWKITGYKRSIDLATGRMRTEETRTAQFLFALATVQRQSQSLDGDVAYNLGPDGKITRVPEDAVQERRMDMLHHPLTIVRAALDRHARLANLRTQGKDQLIDITTANGDKLTLALDVSSKLPLRATSMAYHANLGDVAVTTSFLNYMETAGLKLPRRLVTTVDKYPQLDLRVTKYTVDGPVGDLSAPQAVRSIRRALEEPVIVIAEPVAKGIWWLAGSGNYRSVLFEFDDHLTLFEVPLNEARSKAVIENARAVVQSKPLTQVIVSHHHFDHSGGLRVAVAEGLTIITYRGNIEFFKELAARKHSIVQDELAKNPKPLKTIAVDDELKLKDNSMEVQLYHLKDNPREGTNIFAYVPRDRILVQADLYDSTWTRYPWAENVLKNIEMRHLQIDKDVPVHGQIQFWADVLKTMEARK